VYHNQFRAISSQGYPKPANTVDSNHYIGTPEFNSAAWLQPGQVEETPSQRSIDSQVDEMTQMITEILGNNPIIHYDNADIYCPDEPTGNKPSQRTSSIVTMTEILPQSPRVSTSTIPISPSTTAQCSVHSTAVRTTPTIDIELLEHILTFSPPIPRLRRIPSLYATHHLSDPYTIDIRSVIATK
jgi:hypothetical protein